MNDEKELYLISESGTRLTSRKEIIDYLRYIEALLKKIRKTPKFAEEFRMGNMENYYRLSENLKLKTKYNQKLSINETYDWLEKNGIK